MQSGGRLHCNFDGYSRKSDFGAGAEKLKKEITKSGSSGKKDIAANFFKTTIRFKAEEGEN